ncbi:hypothetical protein T492DRAFT_892530 [Pavlovales sp. CCMP2436]|nr:hypothetical protein T492DRAFT_892530 [Pavlovales sp. CCMP2436]
MVDIAPAVFCGAMVQAVPAFLDVWADAINPASGVTQHGMLELPQVERTVQWALSPPHRLFGDEEMVFVGKVWNYRELGGKGLKKQDLWVIKYEDDPEDDTEELSEALSRASRVGLRDATAQDLAQRVQGVAGNKNGAF